MSLTHDQNFKNLILDYPLQAIQFFAAEEADQVDKDVEIIPIRQEQLKERLGERFRELDTPLLLQWPDGRREAIVFILEEESDPARFDIYRLAHYCLDVARLLETERVVPVVIFLRKGSYPMVLTLGSEKTSFLSFRYIACELWRMPAENYWESDNIVARLNLPLMRYPKDEKVPTYAKSVEGLATLESRVEYRQKYIDFIDHYANLDENELANYWHEYVQRNEFEEGSMGIIQKAFQEGELKGIEQGIEQGRAEEARRNVLLVLDARFGNVPANIKAAIENLTDCAELEHKVKDAAVCMSLDDFKI